MDRLSQSDCWQSIPGIKTVGLVQFGQQRVEIGPEMALSQRGPVSF
jgi:hypothetical protein